MSTNVLKFKDSLKDVKTFTRTAASANVINRTIAPLPVAGQFHPTDPTKDFGVMIADFQGALDAQGNPKGALVPASFVSTNTDLLNITYDRTYTNGYQVTFNIGGNQVTRLGADASINANTIYVIDQTALQPLNLTLDTTALDFMPGNKYTVFCAHPLGFSLNLINLAPQNMGDYLNFFVGAQTLQLTPLTPSGTLYSTISVTFPGSVQDPATGAVFQFTPTVVPAIGPGSPITSEFMTYSLIGNPVLAAH